MSILATLSLDTHLGLALGLAITMPTSKSPWNISLVPVTDPEASAETALLKEDDSQAYDADPLSGSGWEDDKSHNPFADPVAAEHWQQVYENAQYEARHVFEPDLTWSKEEERKVVCKLDWHVCLWAVRKLPPCSLCVK